MLEAIRDKGSAEGVRLAEAVELASDDVPAVAEGATWLLRAWLEGGAVLPAAQVEGLADRLARVGSPWARLHIAQSVGLIDITPETRERFAAFLRQGLQSERPFLRAWSMDGLVRLASRYEAHAGEADRALRAAFEDPAASVRARARRVSAEG